MIYLDKSIAVKNYEEDLIHTNFEKSQGFIVVTKNEVAVYDSICNMCPP